MSKQHNVSFFSTLASSEVNIFWHIEAWYAIFAISSDFIRYKIERIAIVGLKPYITETTSQVTRSWNFSCCSKCGERTWPILVATHCPICSVLSRYIFILQLGNGWARNHSVRRSSEKLLFLKSIFCLCLNMESRNWTFQLSRPSFDWFEHDSLCDLKFIYQLLRLSDEPNLELHLSFRHLSSNCFHNCW